MTANKTRNDAPRGAILVADDEPGMRLALREVLTRTGWDITLAESGEDALAALKAGAAFDLLITDFRMGGMNGLELLREARRLSPAMPSVMMTAFGTVEDAVCAMKEGASDYLLKPFSFETVTEIVDRVTSQPRETPVAETEAPRRKTKRSGREVIAEAPVMAHVLDLARDIATADTTVLLTGESGTGKEVVARYIHEQSERAGAFVAINCAALPDGLLESELFGHEKGAFTGAVLSRKGRFEQADGGTLLLDEVSEMPLALQAKLLRVIQEKEIVPVGGSDPIKVDVRIIATSNRDLEKTVANGDFRQDLYYRLNVMPLGLPPLRERREDILRLAAHFIKRYHRDGRPEQHLGRDVQHYLLNHEWPGNVRELENLIERACLLARNEEIALGDLHLGLAAPETLMHPSGCEAVAGVLTALDSPLTLEEMERQLILNTLDRNDGNRTRTAEMLGVSVRTIRNKINQYGLHEEQVEVG